MSSQQRIALITGGNRGIGRSTALALAAKGVDSVITYRTHAEEADAVVAELEALGRKAVALQLDTGDTSAFEAFAGALAAALRRPGAATPSTTSSTTPATRPTAASPR